MNAATTAAQVNEGCVSPGAQLSQTLSKALQGLHLGKGLFPRSYAMYLILALADIIVTWMILKHGGEELNQIAAWFLHRGGEFAMALFKVATVAVVLAICEYVGRKHWRMARRLSIAAVLISATPLAFAGVQATGLVCLHH